MGEVLRTMRLARILNHNQLVLRGQVQDRVHVGHLTVKVHGDPSRHRLPQLLVNKTTRTGVQNAPGLKVLAQLFRIHGVGTRVDVDKIDLPSSLGNGLGGRDERMRNSNYDIPWLESHSHKGKTQCVRSAVHADTMLRAAVLRKFSFESLYFRPSDRSSRLKNMFANGQEFGFKLPVRSH